MDIHRCRFVPYPASPINAVAFSRPCVSDSDKSKTAPIRLAIGRSNGDIEIWNPLQGRWHQEIIIRGGKDRSVDALVWTNEEDEELQNKAVIHGRSRLFSIGYTSTVTEWDLENARAKRHASGQHGDLWCLGAQPMSSGRSNSQTLVGGTMDGCLALYTTEDDDLRFQRMLYRSSKKNVKMVSIAFQSRHTAIVGCSDSTIRVVDVRNGSVLRQMTLGSDLAGGAKDIIAWSVKCLKGGDIVSGDSTGQICIWDGKTYTQAQRIQSHTQDVLSLAASADGKTIMSGGMDRRTVLYRQASGQSSRWTKQWHRRYHSHDVKAMASFEGRGLSVVVSGGPDATPIINPLRKAGIENHRTLSHLPQSSPVCSAPESKLIISWWDREVHIWRLDASIREVLDGPAAADDVDTNRKLIGRILVKGDSNIAAASISRDGTLLVVSTGNDVKAFHLFLPTDDDEELRISKVVVPNGVALQGVTQTAVSPDGKWIVLVQGGSAISMIRVAPGDNTSLAKPALQPTKQKLKRVKREISNHLRLGGLGSYDRHVTHVSFSPDSRLLAVADLAGYVDTWTLGSDASQQNGHANGAAETSEESSDSDSSSDEESESDSGSDFTGPRWLPNPKRRLIPKLPSAPVALAFSSPGEDDEESALLVVTASSAIFAFHPLRGKLVPGIGHGLHLTQQAEIYRNIVEMAKGAFWQGSRVWIWGSTFLYMIDTSATTTKPETNGEVTQRRAHGVKRKRGTGAGSKMSIGAPEPQNIRKASGENADDWADMEIDDADDVRGDSDVDDMSDVGEYRGLQDEEHSGEEAEADGDGPRRAWHTFKFRPILGLVPLEFTTSGIKGNGVNGKALENGAARYPPLEIALVERPIWDVDLPQRYAAANERVR